MIDWQVARHDVAALRERAYRRAVASALRRDETWTLADYYVPRLTDLRDVLTPAQRGSYTEGWNDDPAMVIGDGLSVGPVSDAAPQFARPLTAARRAPDPFHVMVRTLNAIAKMRTTKLYRDWADGRADRDGTPYE